jgi:predicted component of type VI protein secretion system
MSEQLRVAAPGAIRALIDGFLRALPIEWERKPPAGAPAGEHLHYFRLTRDGRLWPDIRASRAVAVHVPAHLGGVSLQLIAVRAGA